MKAKVLLVPLSLISLLLLQSCSGGKDCETHAYQYCEQDILYWVNSCGDFEEIAEHCECGCTADHQACDPSCSCQPDCAGKCCGDDGCGGQCSDACAQTGQSCNTATCLCEGSCQPQTCNDRGFECGTWPGGDGCGGTLNCGNCPAGEECGGDGQCFAIGCPGGLTLCDDMCVDTVEDARYCGDCETRCQPGEVCQNSQCVEAPNCNQTPCTGFAYCDLASGNCMPGCISDNQCPSAQEECNTSTHSCDCAPNMHRCEGVCYLDSDINHCGPDCEVCPGDPFGSTTCQNDECRLTCNNTYLFCGAACAACPTQGVINTACSGGQCVATSCRSGYELCQGACATCPSQGVASTGCSGSQCVATACNSGYELCGGACSQCPSAGVASVGCSGSECVATACNSGYELCGGACSYCPVGAEILETGCDGGACIAIACAEGYYPYGGQCVAWSHEEVDTGYSGQIGWDVQMRVDSNDVIHASYGDGYLRELKYATRVNGSWVAETVDDQGNMGYGSTIELDSQNRPRIAYHELLNAQVRYAYHDGNSWHIETVASATGDFLSPSLALDSSGQPHLCYFNNGNETYYYVKRGSSGWGSPIPIEQMDWHGYGDEPCALAIGSDNQPRVLYRTWDNLSLKLATYNGSSWQKETIFSLEATISPESLVLDAADEPHIIYVRNYNLTYSHKSGTQWRPIVLQRDFYGYANDAQLDLDSRGQPHVSFMRWEGYYTFFNGTRWIEFVVSQGDIEDLSFGLDSSDRPHFLLSIGNYYSALEYWH